MLLQVYMYTYIENVSIVADRSVAYLNMYIFRIMCLAIMAPVRQLICVCESHVSGENPPIISV